MGDGGMCKCVWVVDGTGREEMEKGAEVARLVFGTVLAWKGEGGGGGGRQSVSVVFFPAGFLFCCIRRSRECNVASVMPWLAGYLLRSSLFCGAAVDLRYLPRLLPARSRLLPARSRSHLLYCSCLNRGRTDGNPRATSRPCPRFPSRLRGSTRPRQTLSARSSGPRVRARWFPALAPTSQSPLQPRAPTPPTTPTAASAGVVEPPP